MLILILYVGCSLENHYCCLYNMLLLFRDILLLDPPMCAESLTGAVDIRDEDDDQLGSVGDYMFTPMYTYVYDYRYQSPPAYSEVSYISQVHQRTPR